MRDLDAAPALPRWLARELPFRRHRALLSGGRRMCFVDEGDGLPVLMLHGNPTWSFLWRNVVSALDRGRARCIVPDLYGFGQSDKPRHVSDHTLAMHVKSVRELVERLALERLVVVGQDWGGPIGCAVAAALGDKVAGLVLANTAVLAPARPLRPTLFHRMSHVPLASELFFLGARFPVPAMPFVQGARSSIGRDELRAYLWPFRALRDRAGPLGLARAVPHREGHPSLPLLDVTDAWVRSFRGPASLVWGVKDPVLGRALRRHREALPHAVVVETSAGHFLQEEVPDVLAREIDRVVGESAP